MNIKKIIVCLFCLVIILPIVAAFNINVDCPDGTIAPGDVVTCQLMLDVNVPDEEIFGAQFVINARGFTAGTPFFTPTSPVMGSSGGLGAQTLLFKMTADGQSAGEVATFNLVAGQLENTFDISLTGLVAVSSSTPDSITISAGPRVCIESDWISSDGPCQFDNALTRTWTKIVVCEGGVSRPATESVFCTYTAPVIPCTESDWISSDGPCQPSNTLTRIWTKTVVCEGGVPRPATETVFCTYTAPVIPCTDSDGGEIYYVKGTATGWNSQNNEVVSWPDHCSPASTEWDGATGASTLSGEYLYETVCENNEVKFIHDILCENGCQDGACEVVTFTIDAGSVARQTLLQNILNALDDPSNDTLLKKISAIAAALRDYFLAAG